ncbi:N-acetylglucosamine kinase [Streptomyces sp. NPDC127084]|uniref:N-acetylglucosamine kinase n=1 Tax=Streptomyces sp. NPDC127084 TaxID=3347133 RepID=UPI00364EE865
MDAAVLAIDAGNSKTDVAVVGADGSVLATACGGGFQPQRVGAGAAFDTLGDTVARAFAEAGARGARHVSAALAGADLPVEEEGLAAALRARAWGRTSAARNDTFAVLRAGTDAAQGVAVVCGAGINCVGLLPDGRTARFPALGRLSGDWGGGAGLADEALWWAARAEDGRGEPTELARALPAHFGLDSMYALIEALHLGRVARGRRLELAPVLFAVAAGGDRLAGEIVDRLADEVVAMATVAMGRLGLLDGAGGSGGNSKCGGGGADGAPGASGAPRASGASRSSGEEVAVVLGGGVLAARHHRLDARITGQMAVRAPKAAVTVLTAPPVLGAALLGLDEVGAPVAAKRRLRGHYDGGRGR